MSKIIAGNWKMNGSKGSVQSETTQLKQLMGQYGLVNDIEMIICPPSLYVAKMVELFQGTPLKVGGQDCHTMANGAHTGDISAVMLSDCGARYVIVGHSERRQNHGETNQIVAEKAKAAVAAGLIPIICVGETLAQRQSGQTLAIIDQQLAESIPQDLQVAQSGYVLAYEPVWAIGTGVVASLEQIQEVHAMIKQKTGVAVLYGGSVKPDNAGDIMALPEVDGALVGGASLKASDFWQIITSCP